MVAVQLQDAIRQDERQAAVALVLAEMTAFGTMRLVVPAVAKAGTDDDAVAGQQIGHANPGAPKP